MVYQRKYFMILDAVALVFCAQPTAQQLTFVNTFRQLLASDSGHPGDMCVPRLPGKYEWMDWWMGLWDGWVGFLVDFASVLVWICDISEFQSEYELQCNEVLGWRRRAPTVEGFTKEVKVQSTLFLNCICQICFCAFNNFSPHNILSWAFLNGFPGECALWPIDGGDHPEDCSGQVSLPPLHHNVKPGIHVSPGNHMNQGNLENPGNHIWVRAILVIALDNYRAPPCNIMWTSAHALLNP